MAAAIRARGLRKVFRGRRRKPDAVAVDLLDLTVEPGEVFGFLGRNGAGKTTSVMMLLGCVAPTAGRATLFGEPVGSPASRRRVGFLPEKFRFHEFLTARELLTFHGRLTGMTAAACASRVPRVVDIVGLTDAIDRQVREFSKGMQQRVGLGVALVADPDLLVLDEPTSALDPLGRRDVRDVLLRLKAEGKTVFLNSHLLSEVELCCDRVAILDRGRVLREGPIDDLLRSTLRVDIRADGVTPTLVQALEAHGVVEAWEGDVGELRVGVRDAAAIPELTRALVNGGADVHSIVPHRESLEELFVRVVEDGDGEDDRTPGAATPAA